MYKQFGLVSFDTILDAILQLFKNGKLIREYKFHNVYHRRRMLDIWNAEVKPNGIDTYELIIKLE